jgi:phosphoribosylglycinamide formyltransferase 1
MTPSQSVKPLRTAVLISGSGRTLQNFIDLAAVGKLPITIELVISSVPGVKGLVRAQKASILTDVITRREYPGPEFSRAVTAALDAVRPDLICLAGFLAFWEIPRQYDGKVMNIHPALLPGFGGRGFYGHHVHEAVLAAGCKVSGATVHFADDQYDHGPIIVQRTVPVFDTDTPDALADRVFEQELIAYPEAIRLFAEGRLRIEGRIVRVRRD